MMQLLNFCLMQVEHGTNLEKNIEIKMRIEAAVLNQAVPILINYMATYPNHTYQNIPLYWKLLEKWPSAMERISEYEQIYPRSILESCLKHILGQWVYCTYYIFLFTRLIWWTDLRYGNMLIPWLGTSLLRWRCIIWSRNLIQITLIRNTVNPVQKYLASAALTT